MVILTPKMVENIFYLIGIFMATKNYISNFEDIPFTPNYFKSANIIPDCVLSKEPSIFKLCVFQNLFPEFDLIITINTIRGRSPLIFKLHILVLIWTMSQFLSPLPLVDIMSWTSGYSILGHPVLLGSYAGHN